MLVRPMQRGEVVVVHPEAQMVVMQMQMQMQMQMSCVYPLHLPQVVVAPVSSCQAMRSMCLPDLHLNLLLLLLALF